MALSSPSKKRDRICEMIIQFIVNHLATLHHSQPESLLTFRCLDRQCRVFPAWKPVHRVLAVDERFQIDVHRVSVRAL